MEGHYATIAYVELKHDIHIPLEWPIRGIEDIVLFLAEKIIMKPDSLTYFLEIQNIPAKIVRRRTRSGLINIFRKVPHEELIGAYRCDIVLPIDDRPIKIGILSGYHSCSNLLLSNHASASRNAKATSYHILTPRFKNTTLRDTDGNYLAPRRSKFRNFKWLTSKNAIALLLIVIVTFGLTVTLLTVYLKIIV